MNTQAPRVATWLAERFLTSPRRDSLIGDLVEQYREGRSATWYWGQVFRAIVVSITEELAAHKLLALRAVAVGMVTTYLLQIGPVVWVGLRAEDWVIRTVVNCQATGGGFWCQTLVNQFSFELVLYVACALTGWIVARLHRPHGVAALCVFIVAFLLWECVMMALFSQHPPPDEMSVSFTTVYVTSVIAEVGRALAILIGGLAGARHEHALVPVERRAS
jgi:hypothetical protein